MFSEYQEDTEQWDTVMLVNKTKIKEYRLKQPLTELKRKRDKAWRKGIWTQEDIDYAQMSAQEIMKYLVGKHNA